MKVALYSIIAYLAFVQLTWFALMIAMVWFKDYSANGITSIAQYAVRSAEPQWIYRMAASIGAVLLALYSDKHPLYKGAAFGSFSAQLTLLWSWIAVDLWFAVQAVSMKPSSMRYNICTPTNSGICMTFFGTGVMSISHAFGLLALLIYSIYQLIRSTEYIKLNALNRVNQALVVLGLASYTLWVFASIQFESLKNSDDVVYMANLLYYTENAWLNGLIVFALTSAAVASYGANQSWRTAAWWLNVLHFVVLTPAFIFEARAIWSNNLPSVGPCGVHEKCPGVGASIAGMGGVLGVELCLIFALLPLVFLRTAPEFATGVKVPELNTESRNPYAGTQIYEPGTTPTASFNGNYTDQQVHRV